MATGLSVRNSRAVIANLKQYQATARERAKVVVQESADRVYQMQQSLCAVDTGFMRSQVRREFSPGGFSYRVGWHKGDFPQAFYPPFVEFGTRFQGAQPSLLPAMEAERPRFAQALREALRTR